MYKWIVALVLASSVLLGADDQRAKKLLQSGRNAETIDGDLRGAAILYEQAFKEAVSRELAATALLRLGDAHRKTGDIAKARAALNRLRQDYREQSRVTAEAQALLNLMAAPATIAKPAAAPAHVRVATGNDADPGARLTVDGRFLARQDWDSGDLVVRDMVSESTQRLLAKPGTWEASDAFAGNALFSPDGKQIAYLWYPDAPEGGNNNYQLRLMPNAVGGEPAVLIENEGGEYCCFEPIGWSADGQSILVTVSKPDRTWQIARVSIADKTVTPIQTLGWRLRRDRPSLSPDGKYLAYSALAREPAAALGRNEVLPKGVAADQHIYALPVDGSSPAVELVRGANINESPVWTPDGRHILFISNRANSFGLWAIPILNGKAAGTAAPVRDANIPGRILPLGMTQSGSYYYVPDSGPGGFDVFVADLEGSSPRIQSEARRLLNDVVDWNRAPAWSPDGKRIAFKRKRPDNASGFDLTVFSTETGAEKSLSLSGLDNSQPLWFSDSRSLLIRRNNYPGGPLFRYNVDTGIQESIQALAHSVFPPAFRTAVLSPDDSMLYMVTVPRNRGVDIVTLDLTTGHQKPIWSVDSLTGALPKLAISPDGKSIAMTLTQQDGKTPRLIRINTDGTDVRELASSVLASMFAWARDSRALFYVEVGGEESRVMRIAADGNSPPEATGIVLNQACACGHAIDLSPDGSKIIFSDSTRKGDSLWRLDNLSILLRSAR